MLEIRQSTRFRRDVKLCQKQGKNMDKFKAVHELLVAGKPLPDKNRDHALTGEWRGFRECHLEPDWLLIYQVVDGVLGYARMGSHAELFD